MTYQLPALDYKTNALEPVLSAEIVELHHSKHHAAYVAGANKTLDSLRAAREKDDFAAINQLQKDLAFHLSGHVLHSLFWKNLSPNGGGQPQGALLDQLVKDFGSVGAFQKQFNAAAMGVQGSGWAALAWEPISKQLLVHQVYDHQDNFGQGTVPLLVLDMWEHAFYLQYKNVKANWVQKFWDIVHWQDVAARLQRAGTVPASI